MVGDEVRLRRRWVDRGKRDRRRVVERLVRRRRVRLRFRGVLNVGRPLHLADERLRGILDFPHDAAGFARDARKLIGAEEQESGRSEERHVGDREHWRRVSSRSRATRHARLWRIEDGAPGDRTEGRLNALKIIYTRGNRTETLASIATLRKILNRFVAHRVFYEVSSRNKRGHEFFSAKNTFVVGSIEIVNRDYLTITIFDANNASHSIEILNPAAMRIYDDTLGKGFAVSFLSEGAGGVESRCYLRDEGEDGDGAKLRCELEKITLPQLFEYLEDITSADVIGTKRI